MDPKMVERYRRWFEYEKDSHAKVLESLSAVPRRKRSRKEFQKAVSLMAHIAAARRIWLVRMGIAKKGPTDFFPRGLTLGELSARLRNMEKAWSRHLAKVTPSDLERVFEYTSTEGISYRNRVEDIFTQLFGHSWYHRGQVAQLLRSIGCEPAATDLVFWTRERISKGKEKR